ncbi:MAG TPA: O-methyltransferase [Bacteroidia bacterium]|nr:O-methyltransferase [Bacteroidia bacterium]
MEFIDEKLLAYCEAFTQPETELLKRLNRETHLRVSQARMLSGHLQGRLLAMLSKLVSPSFILEIGTYTGYSALCLAEGLVKGGKLISMDVNEETMSFAQSFVDQSSFRSQIELRLGDATSLIPLLPEGIDLVFIDADKKNYGLYFDLVLPKMRSGGLILADNVLWSGKVLDAQKDEDTQRIHDFNVKVQSEPSVETVVLPVRDGLSLIRKK